MQNKIFNTVIVVLSACIFVFFLIFSHGLSSLVLELKMLNFKWVILAIFCMLLFWSCETIIIYIITFSLNKSTSLLIKSVKIAMIGQFFSAITPFQSGSQPAQLYIMTENGIPAGHSGSILMIKFIIHQAMLTIYSIVVLILTFSYFNSRIPYLTYFCVFGFFVNTLIIFCALLFAVNNKVTKKVLWLFLKILGKIKLVKDPIIKFNEFEIELMSFHKSAAFISKNIVMCVFASLLTLLQWTAYYTIPYCIYRSFGFNIVYIWTMIAAQVFLTMFMSFIPLPGAAGGAEGGFCMIFGLFFKAKTIIPALLLWRVITYYSCIGVGALFSLIPNSKLKKIDV
jgi:uncharacterized protein (TIRG00374 family)